MPVGQVECQNFARTVIEIVMDLTTNKSFASNVEQLPPIHPSGGLRFKCGLRALLLKKALATESEALILNP